MKRSRPTSSRPRASSSPSSARAQGDSALAQDLRLLCARAVRERRPTRPRSLAQVLACVDRALEAVAGSRDRCLSPSHARLSTCPTSPGASRAGRAQRQRDPSCERRRPCRQRRTGGLVVEVANVDSSRRAVLPEASERGRVRAAAPPRPSVRAPTGAALVLQLLASLPNAHPLPVPVPFSTPPTLRPTRDGLRHFLPLARRHRGQGPYVRLSSSPSSVPFIHRLPLPRPFAARPRKAHAPLTTSLAQATMRSRASSSAIASRSGTRSRCVRPAGGRGAVGARSGSPSSSATSEAGGSRAARPAHFS